MNKQIFIDLKNNKPVDFSGMSTKQAYLYIKAHKLVDFPGMVNYWRNRDKTQIKKVIKDHYPPLKHNHSLEDGYEGLEDYVSLAKEVFNGN